MTLRLLLLLPACLAIPFIPCISLAAGTPEAPAAARDNAAASQTSPETPGPPSPEAEDSPVAVPPPARDNAAVIRTAPVPPGPPPPGVVKPPPAGDNAAGIDNTWMDRSHGFVEMCLFTAVEWCDRFLGGETLLRGSDQPRASLWWKNDFRYDGLARYTFRTAFRVGVRLPRLADKWRVVIAGENKGDPTAAIPVDPGTPGANVASPVRTASGGLVYGVFRTEQAFFDLGAGVQFHFPLDAYGRARFGYVQPLGSDTLGRFTTTGAYRAREGPGLTNQLDFEHRLTRATHLVWANSASLYEESNGWAWGTEASLHRMLSGGGTFKVGGSVRGNTRPSFEVQNYRLYTGYRRNILRRWLFWELEPDVNWPLREDGTRDLVWGATLRLELYFLGKGTGPEPPRPLPAPPPPPPDIPTGDG